MGSVRFKNKLVLKDKSYGLERRQNLTKEELSNSSPLPEPVNYEDVDKAFKDWVEKEIDITYEGERIPTFVLYTNQRFAEYMQMWEHVDDKKNPILNFKTVTRENNPQTGTINDDSKNIPGERTFLMKRVEARDKNDRRYYIDYRMKQPLAVDFKYRVSIMTNKYELINAFNQNILEKFKAITSYIRIKGHFMSMNLESLSDESVYNIDDRQFYSQTAEILLKAYLIPENYFVVEEKPAVRLLCADLEQRKDTYADIEEMANPCPENGYYYKPLKLILNFGVCEDKIKFTMDCNFTVEKIERNNIRSYIFKVNDEVVDIETIIANGDTFLIKEGDEVKVKRVRRVDFTKDCTIWFLGTERDIVYDHRKDGEGEQLEEEVEFSLENVEE